MRNTTLTQIMALERCQHALAQICAVTYFLKTTGRDVSGDLNAIQDLAFMVTDELEKVRREMGFEDSAEN